MLIKKIIKKNVKNKKTIIKIVIGLIAGIISGLFSTGGGMILVPAFIYLLEEDSKKARGTSIFCILSMVITTSIIYYQTQYIRWNTAILCAIGGSMGGIIGTRFLRVISEKYLKIIFAIFLCYVSFKMLRS